MRYRIVVTYLLIVAACLLATNAGRGQTIPVVPERFFLPVIQVPLSPDTLFVRHLNLEEIAASYLASTDWTLFNPVSNAMTIEAWIHMPVGWIGSTSIVNKPDAYSAVISTTYGISGMVFMGEIRPINLLTIPGWHHVAIVHHYLEQTTYRQFYIDGFMSGGSTTFPTVPLLSSTEPLSVNEGSPLLLEELRISISTRYSPGDYEVPLAPFACDEQTMGLWHFDENFPPYQNACSIVGTLAPVVSPDLHPPSSTPTP